VVPAEVRHDLFLVVKEALTNALRHSQAAEVRLRLAEAAGTLTFEISDNGRGLDSAEASGSRRGNGLKNMRERVKKLGGDFRLISAPGHGAKLQFSIEVGSRQVGQPLPT
jgi:signal transduction histidine kinase